MKRCRSLIVTLGLLLAGNGLASAEILALLNYESKPNQSVRREGIAIMDIDPKSGNFGKILEGATRAGAALCVAARAI